MRLGLYSPALSRRRRTLLLGSDAPDLAQSTFTASAFANAADGATVTTLTFTAKDAAGNTMANVPLTWSVSRITLDAAESFISVNPSDIDSDGVDSSVITAQVSKLINGEYVGMRGIPGASVVLAVTGAGNTVTQPAAATNASGVTTGSVVSTEAAATKTVSQTTAGLAMTQTATLTTDGSVPPPGGTDPDFTDSFAGTQLNDSVGVWDWATSPANVSVVSWQGSDAIRFRFGPDASGEDSTAEQRFTIGENITRIYLEYDVWVPTNYAHRNDVGSDNNKWLRLWGDSYNSGNKIGASTYYSATHSWGSKMRGERAITAGGSMSASSPTESPNANIAPALGQWVQHRWYFKHLTGTGANDGIIQFWVDGVEQFEWTNLQNYYMTSAPYWNAGYLMGWSNSGFLDETDIHWRTFKAWWTNVPAWA